MKTTVVNLLFNTNPFSITPPVSVSIFTPRKNKEKEPKIDELIDQWFLCHGTLNYNCKTSCLKSQFQSLGIKLYLKGTKKRNLDIFVMPYNVYRNIILSGIILQPL